MILRYVCLPLNKDHSTYAFRFSIIQSLREHHNDLLMQSSGRGSRYKQLYNSMDRE